MLSSDRILYLHILYYPVISDTLYRLLIFVEYLLNISESY